MTQAEIQAATKAAKEFEAACGGAEWEIFDNDLASRLTIVILEAAERARNQSVPRYRTCSCCGQEGHNCKCDPPPPESK